MRKLVPIFLVCTPFVAAQEISYRNIRNEKFNAVGNGPQSAIVLRVKQLGNDAEVAKQISDALQRRADAKQSGAANCLKRAADFLNKRQNLKINLKPGFSRLIILADSKGSLLQPDLQRNRSQGRGRANDLTLTYQGWSVSEETALRNLFSSLYPVCKQIYGDPYASITVNVVKDDSLADNYQLFGGLYNATLNEIRLPTYDIPEQLQLNFVLNLLRAFHDDAAFGFDSWEDGFARAATVAVTKTADASFSFDLYTDFYLMQLYDLMNQPALGNSTYYPASGYDGMLYWRHVMSAAAWLKCYAENRNFFSLLNASYYPQFTADPSLANNTPGLRGIAASVLPSVENQPFQVWYEQQYALDTSVTFGKKVYAYNAPTYPSNPDVDGYSLNVILQYYSTAASGNETALQGVCFPTYYSWDFLSDFYLGAQYERVELVDGQGAVAPTFFNVGGPQRVTIDFTINTESQRIYFPYGYSGTESNSNKFFGVLREADAVPIFVDFESDPDINPDPDNNNQGEFLPNSNQGGFGFSVVSAPTGLTDFSRTQIRLRKGGVNYDIQKNTGFDFYIPVLDAAPVLDQVRLQLSPGFRMFSVPIIPAKRDPAEMLNLPQQNLLMAWWNPAIADPYKYVLYAPPPNSQLPAFQPGRAYWIKLESNVDVQIQGRLPDPAADYRIGLIPGWNMIANPFISSRLVSELLVESGADDPVPFAQAASNGVVGGSLFRYNDSANRYDPVSSLDPFDGVWVRCLAPDGAVITVPGASRGRSRSGPSGGGRSSGDLKSWLAAITATFASGGTKVVEIGRSATAKDDFDPHDLETPPAFVPGGAFVIFHKAWKRAAGEYIRDVRSQVGTQEWRLTLTPKLADEEITLRWEGLSRLPKGVELVLIDPDTGTRRFLRTAASYRTRASALNPKEIIIRSDGPNVARLQIPQFVGVPSRAYGSVTFAYSITQEAELQLDIRSLNGKTIRVIPVGAASQGQGQTVWDGRDASGRRVPAGLYVASLTAVSGDGEKARAVAAVNLRR